MKGMRDLKNKKKRPLYHACMSFKTPKKTFIKLHFIFDYFYFLSNKQQQQQPKKKIKLNEIKVRRRHNNNIFLKYCCSHNKRDLHLIFQMNATMTHVSHNFSDSETVFIFFSLFPISKYILGMKDVSKFWRTPIMEKSQIEVLEKSFQIKFRPRITAFIHTQLVIATLQSGLQPMLVVLILSISGETYSLKSTTNGQLMALLS